MGEQKRNAAANADTKARISAFLRESGVQPGQDCVQTLIERQRTLEAQVRELAEYRGAHEAPGWNYEGDHSAGAHISDAVVAGRVRMLMRNDLDHEPVCLMARDRIRDLSRHATALEAALRGAGLPVPPRASGG